MKKKQRKQRRKKAKRNEEERKENGLAMQQHMTPVSNLTNRRHMQNNGVILRTKS